MKNYVKGIITGFLIAAVVFAVPAMAVNLDAVLNAVRINVNGVDEIQWDEDITLSNGETAPASILYNGTTYLSMRKLGELNGQRVYWNGDSKTVSMTGAQNDIKVIAKKPDKDGNMWEYYTFKATRYDKDYDRYEESCYLGVKDETRGYERAYRVLNGAVKVTDDALFFVREAYKDGFSSVAPTKMIFKSDKNNQDGTLMQTIYKNKYTDTVGRVCGEIYSACFEGDYMFVCGQTPGNGAHAFVMAYNCLNGQYDVRSASEWWTSAKNITAKTEGDEIIVNYVFINGVGEHDEEIIYDKTTNTFSENTRLGVK